MAREIERSKKYLTDICFKKKQKSKNKIKKLSN